MQQTLQRWVVRAFLGAFAERLRVDRSERRTAARIHNSDHNLDGAWRVEHDSVPLWATVGNLHKLACTNRVH
jgi:hypothetical protein